MSFPAKENLIFFETLAKSQTRLWNDACDLGIELADSTGKYMARFGDIALKDAARTNLMELMETYAYKLERSADRRHSVTSIFIPFEFDEGYVGVDLHVAFSTSDNDHEYLHIAIKRARRTHTEANVNGPLFKQKALGPEEDEYTAADEAAWNEATDDRDMDNDVYTAEQSRSNPAAWAEAAYEAKRFNR